MPYQSLVNQLGCYPLNLSLNTFQSLCLLNNQVFELDLNVLLQKQEVRAVKRDDDVSLVLGRTGKINLLDYFSRKLMENENVQLILYRMLQLSPQLPRTVLNHLQSKEMPISILHQPEEGRDELVDYLLPDLLVAMLDDSLEDSRPILLLRHVIIPIIDKSQAFLN